MAMEEDREVIKRLVSKRRHEGHLFEAWLPSYAMPLLVQQTLLPCTECSVGQLEIGYNQVLRGNSAWEGEPMKYGGRALDYGPYGI